MFRVNLKTLLGLILPNQYYHVVMRKNQGRFLGYIISLATPTPSMSLLYSTIVLYDIPLLYTIWYNKHHIVHPYTRHTFSTCTISVMQFVEKQLCGSSFIIKNNWSVILPKVRVLGKTMQLRTVLGHNVHVVSCVQLCIIITVHYYNCTMICASCSVAHQTLFF